jgi:putative peptidoglycan lipid II flippase
MGVPAETKGPNRLARLLRVLRPSHEHSAFSATLLLMSAVLLSGVIGYIRESYIAWQFGAQEQTDAFVAAFTLPDLLYYMVAGGTVSITFISIFTRYLAQKQEEEAEKAFSVIITVMTTVLIIGVGLCEIFTAQILSLIFRGFTPSQLQLCTFLTRILLPMQILFYVGGVVSAVLQSRRFFLIPALAPLIYNVFIILGGVVLSHRVGIASLAYGAVAGCFVGPFLLNAIGAGRTGIRFRLSFNVKHPAFLEWLRLSIPLMLGVSLVAADSWIMRGFASYGAGDISRLNYAKRLFMVPIAVLGQATGQASLPFFARLWGEGRRREFSQTVSGAVYRIAAASCLVSAWMMAASLPLVDLLYRRGRFHFTDSQETAVFFFWFGLSLALWAAQGLYSRGFYAAGDTLTPMIAGTIITAVSLPVYWLLFRTYSVVGLAFASDIGIVVHTVVLAVMLHRRKLVPAGDLPWGELGKAAATAVFAGLAAYSVARLVPLHGSRIADLQALALASVTWAAAVAVGLWITRSQLPGDLRRRKAAVAPAADQQPASSGIES